VRLGNGLRGVGGLVKVWCRDASVFHPLEAGGNLCSLARVMQPWPMVSRIGETHMSRCLSVLMKRTDVGKAPHTYV